MVIHRPDQPGEDLGGGFDRGRVSYSEVELKCKRQIEQEEIVLWTGVEHNGSIHDRNVTGGMRLTMAIWTTLATGLCIGEYMDAMCLYCPPRPKGFSEQEEQKRLLIDWCLQRR